MKELVPAMSDRDRSDLIQAKLLLENPGIAARIANFVGVPIEVLLSKKLPKPVARKVNELTHAALVGALRSAIFTMKAGSVQPARTKTHKLAVAVTGGVGGVFGWLGLAVELPVTTTVMLRSIADIARSEGEQLDDPAAAMACLEVLAHGGRSRSDDGSESGYFAVRAMLAQQMSAAAQYIAAHGFANKGAPAVIALIANIASRFSITVSEKVAAQAVPVVGAIGGAALNTLFLDHFQAMARGHFIIRRLERTYGPVVVKQLYMQLEPR